MHTYDIGPAPVRGRWKWWSTSLSMLLVVGLAAGCATTGGAYLQPGPTASVVPQSEQSVVDSAAGVRLVANGNAWHGNPINLGSVITAVRVRIYNTNSAPIQIKYRDFRLTAAGFKSMALPPYKVNGSVTGPGPYGPLTPGFAYSGFYIAPFYAPFYSWRFDTWDGPFDWDPEWHTNYYGNWNTSIQLPTADMQAKAIPEGVLDHDGQLSGFLYFRKVSGRNVPVTLTFDIVNARTNAKLGTIQIPFVSR